MACFGVFLAAGMFAGFLAKFSRIFAIASLRNYVWNFRRWLLSRRHEEAVSFRIPRVWRAGNSHREAAVPYHRPRQPSLGRHHPKQASQNHRSRGCCAEYYRPEKRLRVVSRGDHRSHFATQTLRFVFVNRASHASKTSTSRRSLRLIVHYIPGEVAARNGPKIQGGSKKVRPKKVGEKNVPHAFST